MGERFAGRVAGSLLHAAGLSELVTDSLAAYEAKALALARNRDALDAIKARLQRNRVTHSLFDTTRSTRNLERAFLAMWERHQHGLPPQGFAVGKRPRTIGHE
jgi:predicted O-linked N-acetylglucosamine transferase (SPINDLY family)